jgi:hypothetical protein
MAPLVSLRGALRICSVLGLILSLFSVSAQPSLPPPGQHPPGSVNRLEDLPAGRFRSTLANLPLAVRERALGRLRGFHFTDLDLESLQVDAEGGVFYADVFQVEPVPVAATTEPVIAEAAVPVNPFPAGLIFHSRPGAPNVLFLDFDGENVTGTQWNSSLGRTTIPAVAFSTDTNFTTFSDSEQVAIKRIWERIAEDYAAFNIDVTTERPATFTTRTAQALITRNTDADGAANPSSTAGGVAYVNVFATTSYATYRPAWIYFNNLASAESYIAEAASHEIGHNMGLSHDGTTAGSEYYGGHGTGDTSWGPLMGTGYNRNVSQWCKGEYYLANNTQDDLAIIAGKVTYRADDHGNIFTAATALVVQGGTNVTSTTPETDWGNINPANKGVIERNTDVDVFSFTTGSGAMTLTVRPWIMPSGSQTRGGNLDVITELFDQAGVLLATNNPETTTSATIQTNLTDGVYYLRIRNAGTGSPLATTPTGYTSYGSVGQYFISGTLTPSAVLIPPQAHLQVADLTQPGFATRTFTVTYTDNVAIQAASLSSGDVRITGPNGYNRLAVLVSVDVPGDGTPRVVTYAATAPDNTSWTLADNGLYTIRMETNQVADTEGAWVAGGDLGHFTVSIPRTIYSENFDANPGWTLDPLWQYGAPLYTDGGPTGGYTGTNVVGYNLSGNYENNLAAKFATTPAIDCSGAASLTLRFYRWLGLLGGDTANIQVSTNGTDWTDLWSAGAEVLDNGWQAVQYPLPSWVDGSPTLRLRWGMASNRSKNDLGWNIDDIEILSSTTIDTNPPVQLTAVASPSGWGTVTPGTGSYPAGSSVDLLATPATYYRFYRWTGGATGQTNAISLTLVSNTTVTAEFKEVLTTNYPTPYWWLASCGYTNNFEAVVAQIGANGMALWQSWIAGLDPADPTSQLRLRIRNLEMFSGLALDWGTISGRVYTVEWSTNVNGYYIPLSGATNLPWTVTGFTNTSGLKTPAAHYRLRVTQP